ncbi:DoxX family protein [Nocardia brasiliensis]|uniref:DoxX family protein n=1 Tax=Nocardia brasiliensis TaxID=37326 RepID=UPI00366EBC7C
MAKRGDVNAVDTESVKTDDTAPAAATPTWNLATRVAFRFSFVYFVLFCLVFGLPRVYAGIFQNKLPDWTNQGLLEPLSPILAWVGRQVFGADVALHQSGSGDQAIIWVFVFCNLVVALAATAVWTVLDRRRPNYQTLHAWFLLGIRLCLAGTMLVYGLAKAIPLQMPEPPLTALLTPYGNFTPMGVLWLQVGSSPAYEMLLGLAEVLAGVLLFLPRTATLGALLSLVSMAQVFILNMTFGVPVKILAFHLVLLSLVLLAPQARKLANVLVLQRPTGPARQPDPFRTRRVRLIAVGLQVALGAWVILGLVPQNLKNWNESGSGAPKPPLYGIWSVSEFSQNGQPLPPLITDQNRWQRVIFDVGAMTYQKMDGSLVHVIGAVDSEAHTITVSEATTGAGPVQMVRPEPKQIATFTFTQPAPDRLRLDGQLNGHAVTVSLEQVDLDSFRLRSTEFRWVQDYPR